MKTKYTSTEIKHCQKCNGLEYLHINSSYINPITGIKRINYMCRGCTSERLRKYRETPKGKEVFREIMRRQYKNHKEKVLARQSLKWARVRKHNPIIKPDRCEICNEIKPLDGHHSDYSKRLEVKWVCRQCHFIV